MKKILFITDAVSFNGTSLEFACYLCNLTHSKLTGVFLENQVMELRSAEDIREMAVGKPVPGIEPEDQKDLFRDKNIERFKNICESNGVNCLVHMDKGMPATEVIQESRYADLIVLDAATSFSWKPESVPTAFVKEVLEKSECPVILAPESFDGVDEIVFTYNGSCSSVFAMKQFANMFPELGTCKATVLSVTGIGKPIKGDESKLREWLDTHYTNAEIQLVEDERVSARLLEFMISKEKVFIVMGAYGRSILSTVFVPNPASLVVKLVTRPFFITHY